MNRLPFLFLASFAAAAAALAVGCGPLDVGPGSASYEAGRLGNGGFAFTCDDSVACGRFDAAKEFPDGIALGSTFTLRFIPRDPKNGTGITLDTVGSSYLSNVGAGSFVATGEGFASVVAKDRGGSVLEWIELPIVRPDALVIFDAKRAGARVETVTLDHDAGDRIEVGVFAESNGHPLAGSLSYEWTTTEPDVVTFYRRSDGQLDVSTRKPGTATLRVEGGTLTQSLEVVVR